MKLPKQIVFLIGFVALLLPSGSFAASESCVCSGSVGLSFVGGVSFEVLSSQYGISETDLKNQCSTLGGKYESDGYRCNDAAVVVTGVRQEDCNEGVDAVKTSVIANFGVPSSMVSVAESMLSYSVRCKWEEPNGAYEPTGGLAAGSGAALLGGNRTVPNNISTTSQPSSNSNGTVSLPNPLGTKTKVAEIIRTLISGALGIVGGLALLMMVWGGFQWLTSAGNSEKVEAGTKTMIWAAIGVFLVFASYLILNTFTSLIASPQVVSAQGSNFSVNTEGVANDLQLAEV